jgi:hypothetical protein
MNASSPSERWHVLPTSPLLDVLKEDEDVEDVVVLSAAELPNWLQQLRMPTDWQLLPVPDSEPPMARIALYGPLGDGEWEAAETITVCGYTGWPVFYDVFHSADGILRALQAAGVSVKVLRVPPLQRTAAIRSSGFAVVGGRNVWVQQSHYLSGSEEPHASRLIIHTLFVEAARRAWLTEDINRLSDAVYHGFTAALVNECGSA